MTGRSRARPYATGPASLTQQCALLHEEAEHADFGRETGLGADKRRFQRCAEHANERRYFSAGLRRIHQGRVPE